MGAFEATGSVVVTVIVLGYLLYALIRPERF